MWYLPWFCFVFQCLKHPLVRFTQTTHQLGATLPFFSIYREKNVALVRRKREEQTPGQASGRAKLWYPERQTASACFPPGGALGGGGNGNPLLFLPGESRGRQSLVGCHLWSHTELDTTEAT